MGLVNLETGEEQHYSLRELEEFAKRMRALDLVSIHAAGSGHPGGTLSVMDIAAVLYLDEVRYNPQNPKWDGRDRVFFSAGHKAPAMYAALVEAGYFSAEEVVTLRKIGSPFQGHPHAPALRGIEVSSGSLGQGLGIAVGCALSAKMSGKSFRVYCVMGDGEQQEGSIWEAVMAAAHYGLGNLCAIIDKNKLQIDGSVKDVMNLDPIAEKYRAFGWNVVETDGHSIAAIKEAFAEARKAVGKPTVIIAETIKGKGVSFMENQAGWHGVATNSREQLASALKDVGCADFSPERVDYLLAKAAVHQKQQEESLKKALPVFSKDYWWNAGQDMKVDMVPNRFGFGACLAKIGDDPRIVTIHADISQSIKISDFEKDHPERKTRVVSVGIAEQNMMSVAAGLALEGKIPITGTYGVFAAGRPWDQIRTTICYDKLNVKIAGAHGGISVGPDGATHQALEELNLMTVLPNMTFVAPCDSLEAERLTRISILEKEGPVYIRLAREATPVVTDEKTPLVLGKANIVRYRRRSNRFKDAFDVLLASDYRNEHEDITIISCGPLLCEAMRAAYILSDEFGIEARVINMHTIKPLDEEAVVRACSETRAILTCEEHQKGGLGNLVAGVVCRNKAIDAPFVLDMIGIEDRFGESGGPWELMIKFGLTAEHIVVKAKELVQRKNGRH